MGKNNGVAISESVPIDELIPKDDYAEGYVPDKRPSIDKLLALIAKKTNLLERIKVDKFVDYAMTPKGEEICRQLIDNVSPLKWEGFLPHTFWMWGSKVMSKFQFLGYAMQPLTDFYSYHKSAVDRVAEYMNYKSSDITTKIHVVALYSAYACLEKFKTENPQLLEEKCDPTAGKVLLYKNDLRAK